MCVGRSDQKSPKPKMTRSWASDTHTKTMPPHATHASDGSVCSEWSLSDWSSALPQLPVYKRRAPVHASACDDRPTYAV